MLRLGEYGLHSLPSHGGPWAELMHDPWLLVEQLWDEKRNRSQLTARLHILCKRLGGQVVVRWLVKAR